MKTILFLLFFPLSVLFMGQAVAQDATCQSMSQVISNMSKDATAHNVQVAVVRIEGADAKTARAGLIARYGDKIMDFDAMAIFTNDTKLNLLVLFKDGCAVAGGPIKTEEVEAIFNDLGVKPDQPAMVPTPNDQL